MKTIAKQFGSISAFLLFVVIAVSAQDPARLNLDGLAGLESKRVVEYLNVVWNRVFLMDRLLDRLPTRFRKLTLMINVE